MSDASKIRLSAQEWELVCRPDFILTKNHILRVYTSVLSALQDELIQDTSLVPEPLRQVPPKISQGEQYQELPWRILDYPRIFGKEDVCALRSFFWWGKGLSVTLQLAGSYKKEWEERILNQRAAWNDALLCVAADPWQHHWEKSNYLPVADYPPDELIAGVRESSFLKICLMTPLLPPEESTGWLSGACRRLLHLIR